MDDSALVALAASQHGLVARSQAKTLGFDRDALNRRVGARQWSWATPRVLDRLGSPRSPWRFPLLGVLDAGFDAVVSHRTAAAMWGVPGFRLEPVAVAVSRVLRRRERPYAAIHHLTHIPEDHRTQLHDIPVVSPALMSFQVAGIVHPARLEHVVDSLLAQRLVTIAELDELLGRMARQGRNGITAMRKLLDDRPEDLLPAQSNNERRFEKLMWEGGIRTLRRQVDSGGMTWIGRVDFRDTELALVVEIQSERYHTSLSHRQADSTRIAALQAAGLAVVVVWDHEIWHQPAVVIDRVRQSRARLLGYAV